MNSQNKTQTQHIHNKIIKNATNGKFDFQIILNQMIIINSDQNISCYILY